MAAWRARSQVTRVSGFTRCATSINSRQVVLPGRIDRRSLRRLERARSTRGGRVRARARPVPERLYGGAAPAGRWRFARRASFTAHVRMTAQQTASPTNRPARFDWMCADSSWTVILRMPCPHRRYQAIAMPRETALPIASQVPEQDGLDGQPPIAPLQVAWDVMLAGYRVPTGWHQHPDRRDERCGTGLTLSLPGRGPG